MLLRDFIVALIYSARQYPLTGIKSPFFLIVHHRGSFRPTQHKVVCKLLLKVVCGRPVPLLMLMIPRLSSLGFGFRFIITKGLPSFVQHSFRLHGLIQDTHRVTRGNLTLTFSRKRTWKSPFIRLFLFNHKSVNTLRIYQFPVRKKQRRFLVLLL